MKTNFKDFRCFGGWLTVQWRPSFQVWWSRDATPPSSRNPGRWIIPLLAFCVSASAAPLPPFPTTTVKRPAPLISPKAASAPKSATMFKPASELPRLPMTGGIAYTAEGEFYFVAAAFKPKNTGLTMTWSTKANGQYGPLAGWGAYPEDQWVSGIAWTTETTVFIRATPGTPTTMQPASASNESKFPGRFIKLPTTKTKPQMPTNPQRTPTP